MLRTRLVLVGIICAILLAIGVKARAQTAVPSRALSPAHTESGLPIPRMQGANGPSPYSSPGEGVSHSTMIKGGYFNANKWNLWQATQFAIAPSGASIPAPDAVRWGTPIMSGGSGNVATVVGLPSAVTGEGLWLWLCNTLRTTTVTWRPPNGWSVVTTNNDCQVFYHTASSEGASPSYVFTASAQAYARYILFETRNNATPSSSPSSNTTGTNSAASAAAITTTSANNLAISCFRDDFNGTYRAWPFGVPTGWNIVIDPSATFSTNSNNEAGLNSYASYVPEAQHEEMDQLGSTTCFTKAMPRAGSTGTASPTMGAQIFAYGASPGYIDLLHLISAGDGSRAQDTISIWRDGEATPSVNHIRLDDLTAGRDVAPRGGNGPPYHSMFISQGVTNGGGQRFHTFGGLPIPWARNIVVELDNNDASHPENWWTNVDWRANSFPASRWDGRAHLLVATNPSYPRTDSVNPSAEMTLLNLGSGHAGALLGVIMNFTGGDNNSAAPEEGYLQGYINGETTASGVVCSGTEDCFGSANGWAGEVAPMMQDRYGLTLLAPPTVSTPLKFEVYRFWPWWMPVNFSDGFKLTWLNGLGASGRNPSRLNWLVLYYLAR